MDIGRLFEFISEMLQRGIPVLTGAILGFLAATAMFIPSWFWRRVRRTKGEPEKTASRNRSRCGWGVGPLISVLCS